MKAVWQFAAYTEDDWTVISNEHEIEGTDEADTLLEVAEMTKIIFKEQALTIKNGKTSVFRESDRYSTYLFAIVAGPFAYHERKPSAGLPPMRIYARKTVFDALSLSQEEMFNVTEAGMHFYKDFFGKAYPFRKYD